VALLARGDPEEVRAGLMGEPARDEARWLEVDVDGIRAVSVYVPNGRSPDSPFYEDKLRFLDAMAERIAELARGPLVVAGDFNVCPSDLDVYDPSAFVGATHVTPAERERFRALLDAGTVDAFRELHPDAPGFTWWDYRQGHFHRGKGLRIDAFLLSPPLAARLLACDIERDFRKGSRPSDHAPLLCELGPR
jgi:exodeoxyribonuclease III